jgi:DNA replicative helicase MCM subunit Mcm2 (Cdc46/Mcm family)
MYTHRYDDLKSAQDNIDLQSTILSRFDLIFIVKDPASETRDAAIAKKVKTAGDEELPCQRDGRHCRPTAQQPNVWAKCFLWEVGKLAVYCLTPASLQPCST